MCGYGATHVQSYFSQILMDFTSTWLIFKLVEALRFLGPQPCRNIIDSAEIVSFLPKYTSFCRNEAVSAKIQVFLHFCRNSFLHNKLFLPNMRKIIRPKYSAETLFGRTLISIIFIKVTQVITDHFQTKNSRIQENQTVIQTKNSVFDRLKNI